MKEMTIVIDGTAVERFNSHYKKTHPRSRKDAIASPLHPSLNSWAIMRRGEANALKQKYKEFIVWLCEESGVANAGIERCEVTVRYYFNRRARHDSDNYTPKFFLDGLTEANVIADDDFAHIREMHIVGGYDKENPRTEIIITY